MPEWMKIYEHYISNTGGNNIEELMNDKSTNVFSNAPRALICVSVSAQVLLLESLHEEGLLT